MWGPEVTGIFFVYGVPDDNLLRACQAVNLKVLTYDYSKDGNYLFSSMSSPGGIEEIDVFKDFGHGAIGDAIREIIQQRHEDDVRRHRRNEGEL